MQTLLASLLKRSHPRAPLRAFSTVHPKDQRQVIRSKGIPLSDPSTRIRDQQEKQEFYGVPMKKMAPKSEDDLLFKLSQKFTGHKDLLNFFESNRELFGSSDKAHLCFATLFKRLQGYTFNSRKTPIDLLKEPQFKVLMSDYNRYLEGEIAKKNKQAVLFDNFMPVFESIIGIHRIHRFKLTLPENVVKTYRRMIADKGFLEKQSADKLAFLIFANSSPLLLSMSIKQITENAHRIAEIIIEQNAPLNEVLSLRDVFNLVYGFGQLHLIPHTELLSRLEPLILANVGNFQPDQLNQIAQFYIRMQRGSEFFLRKLMAELSLRQDDAKVNSQVALIEVMDAKTLRRSDAELDFTLEMRAIARSIIKKIGHLRARDLQVIIPRFLYYQIGMKPYYEMLAIEFSKHADSFSFKDKCKLLEYFALVDIDSGSILKTVQKMCQVYVEAFLIRGSSGSKDFEVPRLGMYSEAQIRYIEDATKDINEMRESIIKIDIEEAKKEGAEELLQKYKDQLEHAETSNLIKLAWSYMVFTTSADKGYKQEQSILWGKLRDLINQKMALFPKNSDKFKLRAFDADCLHQLNAFLLLDMAYKEKDGLKIPGDIRFEPLGLTKSSPHREAEYKAFIKHAVDFLHQKDLAQQGFHDFYRIAGGRNLDSKATAQYFYLNHKQWYFEDTKECNSFVRIRRDHLKKMGITSNAIELDFYDFINFKKGYKQVKQSKLDEEEDESGEEIFSMDVKGEGIDEPVVAYLKQKLGDQ